MNRAAKSLLLCTMAVVCVLIGASMAVASPTFRAFLEPIQITGTSATIAALDVNDANANGNVLMVRARSTPALWVSGDGVVHVAAGIVGPALAGTATHTPTNTPTNTSTPTRTATATASATATITPTNTSVPPTQTPYIIIVTATMNATQAAAATGTTEANQTATAVAGATQTPVIVTATP